MHIVAIVIVLVGIAWLCQSRNDRVGQADREYDDRLAADTLDTYRRMYQSGELK